MTVGTIDFYSLPGSLITGEYPVRSSQQDISSYIVATFRDARFSKDLDQVRDVPYFEDYDICNIVSFTWTTGEGEEAVTHEMFFWITGYHFDTHKKESIAFALTFNAPMSMLTLNTTVNGAFLRLPYSTGAYGHQETISDMPSSKMSSQSLSNIASVEISGRVYDLLWVEVVSKNYYELWGNTSPGSGFSADSITRYGMFVMIPCSGTGAVIGSLASVAQCGTVGTNPNIHYYPSVHDIINNPDSILGIEASSILSINVTDRCPYKFHQSSGQIYLVSSGTNKIDPQMTTYYQPIPGESGTYYCMYRFTGNDTTPINKESATFRLLDKVFEANGTRIFKDRLGNTVGQMPTGNMTTEVSGNNTYYVKNYNISCIPDITGFTYHLEFSDGDVYIPCGHLPWVGNAWETYRAYDLAYDREALSNAIDIADKQFWNDIATAGASAASTAALGAIGQGPMAAGAIVGAGAQFGLSALSASLNKDMVGMQLRMDQALTEHRMQGAPGTAYSPNSELKYILRNVGLALTDWKKTRAEVYAQLPDVITDLNTYVTAYRNEYGYPVNQIGGALIRTGRYQGRLLSATNSNSGPRFERLNEVFNQGFKIIGIPVPTP